jgi:hypothetical protein
MYEPGDKNTPPLNTLFGIAAAADEQVGVV